MFIASKVFIFLTIFGSNAIHGLNDKNTAGVAGNKVLGVTDPKAPKFLQASPDVSKDKEPGFFDLLFHPPVKNRSMDIGLEDSNEGVKKAISLNEAEDNVNRILDQIEETEQNQVEFFNKSFDLQNAQLKEIAKMVA